MHRRMVPRRATMAVLTSMSMVFAFAVQKPAVAKTDDQMPIESFVIEGAGPTLWDGNNAYSGCDISGYTPIYDGEYKTRTDAYDGGAVLGIGGIAGTGFTDPDDWSPFGTNTYSTGPDDIGTTRIWRTDRALQTSPTLQSLVTLKNTDKAAGHTISVEWDSDLGSDASTGIRASSNGDLNFTAGDRWVVSSDDPTTPSDPVDTSVLFGRHASVKTNTVDETLDGVGCVTVNFSVRLPAGATKYLLFFEEMNGTNNGAIKAAAKFNSVASGSPLLKGISSTIQHHIANWDL